jgi:hypothetical protein
LQNPVGFAQALAVFRPTGYKAAVFKRLLLQNFSFATASVDTLWTDYLKKRIFAAVRRENVSD